jgi:hypothetical protein
MGAAAVVPSDGSRHDQTWVRRLGRRIDSRAHPVEKYKRIDPWECELMYSDNGVVENNCVFRESLSPA